MDLGNKKINKYSIRELRDICQATAPNPARETKVGRFARIFSIYFTKLFLYTPITPNQITALSVIIFFSGIFIFLFNDYYLNIIGSLVVFFSIIVDGCDGETARFRKQTSVVGGMYAEPASHDVQYGFMFPIIAVGLVSSGYSPIYYLIAAIASITKLLYRLLEKNYLFAFSSNLVDKEINKIKQGYKKKKWFIRLVYWIDKNFFGSTGIFLMLFIFSIANRIDLCLWFFAIGYTMLWIALFIKQIHQINKKSYEHKSCF